MAAAHHLALFHPRLVRERVASLDPGLFGAHEETVGVWLQHLKSGALDDTKEVSLHGGFLERIFCDVLGYPTMAMAHSGKWELVAFAPSDGASLRGGVSLGPLEPSGRGSASSAGRRGRRTGRRDV